MASARRIAAPAVSGIENGTMGQIIKTYDVSWKRSARIVQTSRGGHHLRFYLRGRIFDTLPVNSRNVERAAIWVEHGLCSQLFAGA